MLLNHHYINYISTAMALKNGTLDKNRQTPLLPATHDIIHYSISI